MEDTKRDQSLIDSLIKELAFCKCGYDSPAAWDFIFKKKAAIAAMGGALCDSSVEVTKAEGAAIPSSTSYMDLVNPSEIPVLPMSDTDTCMMMQAAYDDKARMIYVLNLLRPYLRTTEPVTASLEKCKKAACAAGMHRTMTEESDYRVVKAVLDAAGVKYAD